MRRIRIIRHTLGGASEIEDWVGEESIVEIVFPSGRKKRFVVTAERIEEFVYGHLLGEGIIQGPEGVRGYKEELDQEKGDTLRVFLALKDEPEEGEGSVIWTSCGQSVPEARGLSPLEPRPLFSKDAIFSLPRMVSSHTQEFRLTGAYHYAFLFSPEPRLLVCAKDIGRHNAVDKVLGAALLAGFPRDCALLYLTGRVSADIVLKALRARVPLVVSPGAALLGAVDLARRYHLGLIGFLRGKRFNVYSGASWLTS